MSEPTQKPEGEHHRASMKVQPCWSRSFSVMKAAAADLKFFTGGEPMATMTAMGGAVTSLEDKDQVEQQSRDSSTDLTSIGNTELPW